MGTRSLTVIKNEDNRDLLTVYRQFDGYPSGHGKDLQDFLLSRILVNGFSRSRKDQKTEANGMGCLAAQLVTHLKLNAGAESERGKNGPGNIYIYPNGSKDVGEEWMYIISPEDDSFHLKVYNYYGNTNGNKVYDGKIGDFDPEIDY